MDDTKNGDSTPTDECSKTVVTTETVEPDVSATNVEVTDADGVVSSAPSVDLPVHVSANDWLLGIADLTGELMRYAITRIGKLNNLAEREVNQLC